MGGVLNAQVGRAVRRLRELRIELHGGALGVGVLGVEPAEVRLEEEVVGRSVRQLNLDAVGACRGGIP